MTKAQITSALANFSGTVEVIPVGVKTWNHGDMLDTYQCMGGFDAPGGVMCQALISKEARDTQGDAEILLCNPCRGLPSEQS